MTTHLVYFYGSTKIITGHNSYSEDSINQRNQIIGINGIDVNPELIEFGEKCFNTPNIKCGIGITGTLYPEKITIMPFFYFYREDLIVRHFEDVIIANENNVKADRIYFPLFHLKIATNEEDVNDTINGIEALLLSIHKKIEKEVKILSSI